MWPQLRQRPLEAPSVCIRSAGRKSRCVVGGTAHIEHYASTHLIGTTTCAKLQLRFSVLNQLLTSESSPEQLLGQCLICLILVGVWKGLADVIIIRSVVPPTHSHKTLL